MTQDINMNLGNKDNLAGLFEAMMGKSQVNPMNQQPLLNNTQPNVGNVNPQISPNLTPQNMQRNPIQPQQGTQNIYRDMIQAKEGNNNQTQLDPSQTGGALGGGGQSLSELLMKIIESQGQQSQGSVGINNYRNSN